MKSARSVSLLRIILLRLSQCYLCGQSAGTYDSSAMSCGVWARTLTLSKGTSTDTVAVGFWLCDLNGGPTDLVGAVDSDMVGEAV